MRTGVGAVFSPIHGTSNGFGAVVVEHQVWVSAGAAQPAFDPVLRLSDRCAHGVLGS